MSKSSPGDNQASGYQDPRLSEHHEMIQRLCLQQQNTAAMLDQLSNNILALDAKLVTLMPATPANPPLTAPQRSSPSVSTREPDLRPSEIFEGNIDQCGGFLLQCRLAFARSPSMFPSNSARITYIVSALKGKALRWAQAFLASHSMETLSSQLFIQEFERVFNHPLQQEEASKRLLTLRQGRKSVAEHSVDFRILAEETGWDELALKGTFTNSLSETIKDQLASRDEPGSLDELISLAIRIDNRLRERRKERDSISHNPRVSCFRSPVEASSGQSPPPNEPEPEPMQIGRTRLTPEERQRRYTAKVCLYCGDKGHFVANCPVRGNGPARQ